MENLNKEAQELYEYAITITQLTLTYRPIDFIKLKEACDKCVMNNGIAERKEAIHIYMKLIRDFPDCSI